MTTVNSSSREAYQFAAEPRTVKSRSKYRGPEQIQTADYDGIHIDQRVRHTGPMHSGERLGTKSSKKSMNTGSRAGIIVREEEPEDQYAQMSDRTVQDEKNLIPYYYVDRPATPEYKPMEPGVDVATQIDDLELFDYVLEVEPILQVLVGKTLVQAQTELREEDEKIEEMRQKMRFDKKRNAELMVTQRKEALHIRKQDEKARREKQHIIEKEDKRILHQRYIARLLAKHTTFGISNHSINVLADQRLLVLDMNTELRRNFMPLLVQNTLGYVKANSTLERNLQQWANGIEREYFDAHAFSVKTEFDRLKKIADDAEAERQRLDREQKHRRERRRKLRLFVNKEAFLEKIQTQSEAKAVEVENAFSAEVTDIFPTAGKESVATIGGLIGELWLILETLQTELPYHMNSGQIVEIIVKLLNEKYHYSQFNINLHAQYQPLIDEALQAMTDDLIAFNANKPSKIQSLMNDLQEINLLQNLSVLSNENLLDPNLLRNINKALISIFFTSVDYKIPEKKPKEEPGQVPAEGQPDGSPTGSQGAEPVEVKSDQAPAEVQSQGSEKILDALEEGQVDQPIEPQEEEEEFKLPEITPLELAMVEAKKKLRLNYVNDWDYRTDCDGIVRWRVGLNRKVEEEPVVPVEGAEKEGENEGEEEKKKDEKEVAAAAPGEKVEVPEPEVEDRDTMLRRLIENDDFIEPFDGSTFEKDRLEFPEKEIKPEEGQVSVPLKIYNAGLVEGKYVVQINERGQNELRRGLLGLVKEIVPEWKNVNDEDLLDKAYSKYKKNEKVVLDTLISDPEQIPIFDLEN